MLYFCLYFCLYVGYLLLIQHFLLQQELFIILQRIFQCPGFQQFFRYIFSSAGFFMPAHSESHCLNQYGFLLANTICFGITNGIVYLYYIIAINGKAFHTITKCTVGQLSTNKLFIYRRAQTITIIFY